MPRRTLVLLAFAAMLLVATPASAQTSVARQQLRAQLLHGSPQSPTSAPAPRVGFDKVQHFTFSFLWTLGAQYTLVNKASLSEREALPASIGTAAAVGILKEVYDWRYKPNGTFSRADLVADGLGIACAVGLILL